MEPPTAWAVWTPTAGEQNHCLNSDEYIGFFLGFFISYPPLELTGATALLCVSRYLFTLDLPDIWENKHADQTLEVLMSDLDPAVMDQFYMKDGVSANDVTRVSTAFLFL